MKTIRELLSEYEMALEDHSFALSKVRKPSLTADEALRLLADTGPSWARIEAVQREIDLLTDSKRP